MLPRTIEHLVEDHFTNEEDYRKIKQPLESGDHDELLTLVKKRNLGGWPHLKVFWFSKDNYTEHSERKKK